MPQVHCQSCEALFESAAQDAALAKCAPRVADSVVPFRPPTRCPSCRQRRRYAYRNDHHFYRNSCSYCRKPVISIYSPDKPYTVLCQGCFWGEQWDPLSVGREFDFSRPFFEQFQELRAATPRLAIFQTQSENSDFTVHSSRNRNCYFASSLVGCEDVCYSDFLSSCQDSLDLFSCDKMELCYSCIFSSECFGCDFLELCTGLTDSALCYDCKGSSWLVGCVGLRKKHHQILNQPASRGECEEAMLRLKTDPAFRASFEKQFRQLELQHPKQASWNLSCEGCSGNYLTNCHDARNAYNCRSVDGGMFIFECLGVGSKDLYDATRCASGELLYECCGTVDLRYSAFCNLCYQSSSLYYCDNCQASTDSFGSMSLKRSKHCILNRQYSESEYSVMLARVRDHMVQTGEWGEFFPEAYSPYCYNESKSFEWYPLSEAEVSGRGWHWSRYEPPLPSGLTIREAMELPVDIREISDSIVQEAIACEVSGKPFRITTPELAFYRKKGLPLPRRSPGERGRQRHARMNPLQLWKRCCEECGQAIESSYSPERPEIVFCERCYQQSMY